MKTIEKSIHIDAPVQTTFAFLADPMRRVEWLPNLMEVRDVSGEGLGQEYSWSYRMAGIRLDGHSVVTEFEADTEIKTKSSGGIESTWHYRFAPTDDGGTDLILTLTYEIPTPVIGRLAEPVLYGRHHREAELAVHNIKEAVEAEAVA